jgi:DNA-binding CsgD family transcriptional regulator
VLVGRDGELASIRGVLHLARQGHASALLLSGEAGTGKTVLLGWAGVEAEAAGFTWLSFGGARADAAMGFAGLLQVVRPLSDHLDALTAGQTASLRGACGLAPSPEQVDRLAVQVAVLLLLAAAAERNALLLTVDDVQWLDVESRDALFFAARRLDSDAVAMIFAARGGEAGHDALLASAQLPALRLDPFDPQAAGDLVHGLRGIRPTAQVAAELTAATGGNPLALTEVAARLTAKQVCGGEPLPAIMPVGASAAHAFADVLARLSADELDALALFALADGEDAAAAFSAAASLGIPPAPAAALEASSLVSFAAAQVTLRHALLASAVLDRTPLSRQREMHRALAAALRASGSPRNLDRHTWHLAEATHLPDEQVASMLDALAVDRESVGGHAAAAAAHERAARLTPDAVVRGRRYHAAADAASMAGYDEWSLQLLTSALDQTRDPVFRARIDHARGVRHITAGRPRSAWTLLPAAAEVLVDGDRHQAGLVLADAALAAFLAGRLHDARATAHRAGQLAPEADVQLATRIVEGLSALHLGDLDTALPLMTPISSGSDAVDLPAAVTEYIVPLSIGLTWSGRYEEATWITDRVIAQLRSDGAFGLLPGVLFAAGYVNSWTGQLNTAYRHASDAVLLAAESGNRLWLFLAHGGLALVQAMLGNLTECRRLAEQAARVGVQDDLWHPRDLDDALGLAALSVGDLASAKRHLEHANTPEPMSAAVFGRPTTADLVEAQVRSGESLSPAITQTIEADVPEDFPAVASMVWRCRAIVGHGDPTEAFENSLERSARARLPWQEARTSLVYGETLRRSGRRVDARHHLGRALEHFERAGSSTWAARAATELAAAGGSAPHRRADAVAELTPQELHVALAVAEGATNREVSALLFLSPKTIEMHLTRAYRKLGVRSRTQLAARLRGSVAEQSRPVK